MLAHVQRDLGIVDTAELLEVRLRIGGRQLSPPGSPEKDGHAGGDAGAERQGAHDRHRQHRRRQRQPQEAQPAHHARPRHSDACGHQRHAAEEHLGGEQASGIDGADRCADGRGRQPQRQGRDAPGAERQSERGKRGAATRQIPYHGQIGARLGFGEQSRAERHRPRRRASESLAHRGRQRQQRRHQKHRGPVLRQRPGNAADGNQRKGIVQALGDGNRTAAADVDTESTAQKKTL